MNAIVMIYWRIVYENQIFGFGRYFLGVVNHGIYGCSSGERYSWPCDGWIPYPILGADWGMVDPADARKMMLANKLGLKGASQWWNFSVVEMTCSGSTLNGIPVELPLKAAANDLLMVHFMCFHLGPEIGQLYGSGIFIGDECFTAHPMKSVVNL